MRRLVVLFVLALVGASIYGFSGLSSGLSADHQSVSGVAFRSELSAIEQNAPLACYLNALDPTSYVAGVGNDSVNATGAAAWANLRIEGLAINQFVTVTLKYHPTAADLVAAKASLEGEMTEAAQGRTPACTGTSAEAVAEMPTEMRTGEIEDQASSAYLVAKLKSAIPLTTAGLESFYKAHTSSYDTLCIAIALVEPADVEAFAQSQKAGLSVAQLALKYSQDASATKGGAYGCYPPTSSAYTGIRADIGTTPINNFPATPAEIDYNNSEFALYVAVTSRTVTSFKAAEAEVLSDVRDVNAQSADNVKNELLYKAAIHVDPAFGQWTLSTAGFSVLPSATLVTKNVLGAQQLAAPAAS